MGVLMVRCPETGGEVSTGIEIDQESFARLPDKLASWKCPLCGREHPWLKCDSKFIPDMSNDTGGVEEAS
jgi:hypothetical protein